MQATIFYSWQSDTPPSANRNLIEEALKRALKAIGRDKTSLIEPVLDRDTAGVAGTPAIADTVFAKIALADLFVADVTIINKGSTKRLTPNPNVLTELGFAIATLGWSRILLVQNTAFGPPERLPFDLRGRRVVQYHLPASGSTRPQERGLLQGRLEAAAKAALTRTETSTVHAGPDVPVWWGTWSIDGSGGMHGGILKIKEVGSQGFRFDLLTWNGSHTGEISGTARIVAPDLAYAAIHGDPAHAPCQVSFRRSLSDGRRELRLDESGDCSHFHGMGASFFGTFVRENDWLFDAGILDEMDLARLHRLVGRYYDPLRLRFQGLSPVDNLDSIPGTVTSGGVRGLYTIMEGILIRGVSGDLWVAFIDDDVVRYFTTSREYATKLPATFEQWRERFLEKPVVYDSDVAPLPESAQ